MKSCQMGTERFNRTYGPVRAFGERRHRCRFETTPAIIMRPFFVVALFSAISAFAAGGATGSEAEAVASGSARAVPISPRDIPIAARVDLVVVGANEGGVAAAWGAARAGASVLLMSDSYFLGDEVSAKARYWLEPDEVPAGEFAKGLLATQAAGSRDIQPAEYKRSLERLLGDAGVMLHFNSRAIEVLLDEAGNVSGVLVANKAGTQAVVAKVVIDSTPAAAVARMAGAAFTPWNAQTVPVSRVCYGAKIPGGRMTGKFCEYSVGAPMSEGSWPERARAEVLLRETFDIVKPDKAHAHRLHMIEPSAIVSQASKPAEVWEAAAQLDLKCFRPRDVAHVWVLSQAAGVARAIAPKLTRPVHLADVGERIGQAARQEAAARAAPVGVRAKLRPAGAVVEGLEVAELLEGHRRYRKTDPGKVPQAASAVPVWAKYDVVVVGGGTSGIPAAYAAASNGAKVLVIEMLGMLGGNRELGTPGYWKGYPYGFNRNKWRSAESFQELRKAGVDIWFNTLACGSVKQDNRVAGVVVATDVGRGAVLAGVVIDASGDGDVCAAAGAQFSYLNQGDLALQEASYKSIDLYANVLPYDAVDEHSLTMHHILARKAGKQDVWDFFPMIGIRETRLIEGDSTINVLDQILGRTYPDLISIAWSAYDPHGYHSSDYVYAGLMPLTKHETKPGFATDIPLRCLLPRGLEGILVVGRSHSMTHDVQASVRMNPDVMNEGYAAGWTAAQAVKTGTSLRKLDLAPIQDHLVEIGNLSSDDRRLRCVAMPEPSDAELAEAAGNLGEKRNLALLLSVPERGLPLLKSAFAASPSLAAAKALCCLGDRTAVDYLCQWLDQAPLAGGQAYQWDAFLSVPEVDAVMWLLGAAGDERAVDPLLRKLRECGTEGASFSHLRAVTTALGRIGSSKAAPALFDFLRREGVAGHEDVTGDPQSLLAISFVKSYIELYAAGALLRCGDQQGFAKERLTAYLDDWRGIFVRYAGHLLRGEDGERNPAAAR